MFIKTEFKLGYCLMFLIKKFGVVNKIIIFVMLF